MSDRATLYDRLVDLIGLGGVEVPRHLPDDVALEWLRAQCEVHDFRDLSPLDRQKRGQEHGAVEEDQIQGKTVHQTAVVADWEPSEYAKRWPVHIVIKRNPASIILCHELTAIMYHGHALNRPRRLRRNGIHTIGIEVECRADGIEGDARTFWRSKNEKQKRVERERLRREATDAQLYCLNMALWYCDQVVERDLQTYFHRQGHRSRIADPGSRIALGISDRETIAHNEKFGTGNLSPRFWRKDGTGGAYNWRIR